MIRFVLYKDDAEEYRWRLVAANNEPIAWGEGYTYKQGAINAINWVKSNAF